jgi:hypothetical protein
MRYLSSMPSTFGRFAGKPYALPAAVADTDTTRLFVNSYGHEMQVIAVEFAEISVSFSGTSSHLSIL